MAKVLIIGAGGVGSVVVQKCAKAPAVFSGIALASRTLGKCEQIRGLVDRPVEIFPVDTDETGQVVERERPALAA